MGRADVRPLPYQPDGQRHGGVFSTRNVAELSRRQRRTHADGSSGGLGDAGRCGRRARFCIQAAGERAGAERSNGGCEGDANGSVHRLM